MMKFDKDKLDTLARKLDQLPFTQLLIIEGVVAALALIITIFLIMGPIGAESARYKSEISEVENSIAELLPGMRLTLPRQSFVRQKMILRLMLR